jgi:hypothetical protein
MEKATFPIDYWELMRSDNRRKYDRLKTNWMERRDILKEEYSLREMAEATVSVRKVHQQRLQTIQRLRYRRLEEVAQSLSRKLLKLRVTSN